MKYSPSPVPTLSEGLSPSEGGSALSEFIRGYLRQELEAIAQAMHAPDFLQLTKITVEPEKPRDGLTVLADGVEWDPGSGEGVYTYYGSAWHKLG